jgi:hypothetical protein
MPSTLKLHILVCGLLVYVPPIAAAVTSTTIDLPGAAITQIFGINNAGQMVGSYNNTELFKGRHLLHNH